MRRWLRARRGRSGTKPARFDSNLVVIGAGAAGLVSAYIAAAARARVTLVEQSRMGGDCLYTGCVPSKTLIQSARIAHQMRHADQWGLAPARPRADFRTLMGIVRARIAAIEPHDSKERYSALGVEVLEGRARLVDPWTVAIESAPQGRQLRTGRSIILATGAAPRIPDLPGLDRANWVTSDTLWDALARYEDPPGHVVVLGGGPVGCELAQALARLGAGVTLVQRRAQLLPHEDAEVVEPVRGALIRDGVEILLGTTPLHVESDADGTRLVVQGSEGEQQALEPDLLLLATGRKANLEGLGLEGLGLLTDGELETNARLQTRHPHILVAGDVAERLQFTHAAAHMAWYATINGLFGHLKRFRLDESTVPHTTFTDPEVARVGVTEQEAERRGIRYETTHFEIAELDRAIVDGAAEGCVKVLTVPGKSRILGATIVASHAGELLAEFVLAMRHGLGLNHILSTVHSYPTWSEANKSVAGHWRRAHTPERLLGWVERYHTWRRGR